jgi:hypothetical protein
MPCRLDHKEVGIVKGRNPLLSSVLILAGVMLCSCAANRRAWTTKDSWYNALPPEAPAWWEWDKLDRARIHEVIDAKGPQAEELLQNVPILVLSAEQASELIGKTLPEVPGTQPYLTRGVYLNRGTGAFSVSILEDQIRVDHSSLGRSAVPMKRLALVLQLERKPTEVFITCSMAE